MISRIMQSLPYCLVASWLTASPALASQYRDAPAPVGIEVARLGTSGEVIAGCLDAAASTYRLSPVVLVILLNVEGGQLGRVSGNTNSTVDIGPMQVNEIWLPDLARHWRASVPQAFLALRDNFCANVEAGAWILRRGLDESRGDFWSGVGFYHSHNPDYKAAYLRKVLDQALRLQARQDRARQARSSPSAGRPEPASAAIKQASGSTAPGTGG